MSKPAIHGFVTPEAHQAWHDYAANHGVSVTAILEANLKGHRLISI